MFLFRRTIEKFFQRPTKQESEDQSSPLTTEQVLREEALRFSVAIPVVPIPETGRSFTAI